MLYAFRKLYINIPEFTVVHAAVYEVIAEYRQHGKNPSVFNLLMECGIGETHATKVVKDLRGWGLLDYSDSPGKRRRFTALEPICSRRDFFERFPEALENLKERRLAISARSSRPKRNTLNSRI